MIRFKYKDTSLLDTQLVDKYAKTLKSEINKIKECLQKGYDTEYASINLSHDNHLALSVKKIVIEKQQYNPHVLIVCGIGGSNLGTKAIHEALQGLLFNTKNVLRVYFVDTVDSDYVHDVYTIAQDALKQDKNILLNVVTKSGTTTETIANFEIFLALLKKYKPYDYNKFVVATTDQDSPLWMIAQQQDFTTFQIPKMVGGRYSVLSAVGLFPLAMLGIDIDELLEGARSIVPSALDENIDNNSAAQSALIKYAYYKRNIKTNVMFVFDMQCAALGAWYRQLISESLGKEYNIKHEKVDAGITPLVSVGTTDLHSIAQLYLGGPNNKFTTFVSVEKSNHEMKLPHFQEFEKCVKHIQGRSLTSIKNAILQGVKKAYTKADRPFCELIIPEKMPYYIGQFLQMYMIEVIYLGSLMRVNPFDQPNVELYKKETREILAHE